MNYSVLLAVSIAALSLAGCKKEPGASNNTEPSAAASEGAAAASTGANSSSLNASQKFADTAAASDAFEIASSQLALKIGHSAKVKHFAEEMIKAHTQSTAKLKTAAGAASPAITPSPQLDPMQQQTLDALASKSGAEFDSAFAKAQADAHQKTLDLLNDYSSTGNEPSLKTFATQLVPIVTAHLNMAKGL